MLTHQVLVLRVIAVTFAAATLVTSSLFPRVSEAARRPISSQQDAHVTRIILLGTKGGPNPNPLRSEPANLLVVDGFPYLIDAGTGVTRQIAIAGFQITQIRTIFITHHHIDHDAGLVALISTNWFETAWNNLSLPRVKIYGPPATEYLVHTALDYLRVSERIFRSGVPALQPAETMFIAHDVLKNGELYRDKRITVFGMENTHFYHPSGAAATGRDISFSYRFNTPNGSVVFTGDTGPSEAVTALAMHADVLVSEVCLCRSEGSPSSRNGPRIPHPASSLSDEEDFHMRHEHLTPEEVGQMAAAAHVKVVILTHFVPGAQSGDPTRFTAGVMKYFSGPVVPAKDFFEYDLR